MNGCGLALPWRICAESSLTFNVKSGWAVAMSAPSNSPTCSNSTDLKRTSTYAVYVWNLPRLRQPKLPPHSPNPNENSDASAHWNKSAKSKKTSANYPSPINHCPRTYHQTTKPPARVNLTNSPRNNAHRYIKATASLRAAVGSLSILKAPAGKGYTQAAEFGSFGCYLCGDSPEGTSYLMARGIRYD